MQQAGKNNTRASWQVVPIFLIPNGMTAMESYHGVLKAVFSGYTFWSYYNRLQTRTLNDQQRCRLACHCCKKISIDSIEIVKLNATMNLKALLLQCNYIDQSGQLLNMLDKVDIQQTCLIYTSNSSLKFLVDYLIGLVLSAMLRWYMTNYGSSLGISG